MGPVPGKGIPTTSGGKDRRGPCLSVLVRWKPDGNPDALLKGPQADSLPYKHSLGLQWKGGISQGARVIQGRLGCVASKLGLGEKAIVPV